MNKSLYETSQRLSIEIILTFLTPDAAKIKTLELLEITQEICMRDYPAILKRIGRQRLQEALTRKVPLQDIDWELPSSFYELVLLYKLFRIFGDEANKKKTEVLFLKECSHVSLLKKYIINGLAKEEAQWLEDLDQQVQFTAGAGISSLCSEMTQDLKEKEDYKLIVPIHEALDDYSTLSAEEYDKKLDSAIIEVFHQYLDSTSDAKDFFYTSLTNTGVHLAKDPITGRFTGKDALEAALYLQSIRLRYIFRDFYPKASFGDEDKRDYRLQGILFDKVFFNEASIDGRGAGYFKYSNANWLLNHYLDTIIPHRALAKSEWIGLYLASKEIALEHFQQLFRIMTPKEKSYKKSAFKVFCAMSRRISFLNRPDSFLKNESPFDSNLDKIPLAFSNAQRNLFKGLLFICMWEKSSYSPIAQKAVNKRHKETSAAYRDIIHYFDRKALHKLFIESPVENLDAVLKEASKLLNITDEGFDYNYYQLEGDMGDAEGLVTLLYFFSRIERESKPALISVLNLLRERQLDYLPIIKNDKVNEANLKKVQEIDKGFKLSYFQTTLYPLMDISGLQISDLDNRYLYMPKTVKFICESDRVYTGADKKDVDWFLSNHKALNTVYLYKIRNQASHFAEDENVSVFTEPKHLRGLLLILIGAFRIHVTYFSDISQHTENDSRWDRIFRLEVLRFIRKHIEFLIKTLCLIAETKGGDAEKLLYALALEKRYNDNFETLEAYLKDTNRLSLTSYELTEEEIKRIMAKPEVKEVFNGGFVRDGNKPFDLAAHYLGHFKEILRDALRFLFSSEVQNYYERTQESSFLKTYHAESAFYMLHLAPLFFPNNAGRKEKPEY